MSRPSRPFDLPSLPSPAPRKSLQPLSKSFPIYLHRVHPFPLDFKGSHGRAVLLLPPSFYLSTSFRRLVNFSRSPLSVYTTLEHEESPICGHLLRRSLDLNSFRLDPCSRLLQRSLVSPPSFCSFQTPRKGNSKSALKYQESIDYSSTISQCARQNEKTRKKKRETCMERERKHIETQTSTDLV